MFTTAACESMTVRVGARFLISFRASKTAFRTSKFVAAFPTAAANRKSPEKIPAPALNLARLAAPSVKPCSRSSLGDQVATVSETTNFSSTKLLILTLARRALKRMSFIRHSDRFRKIFPRVKRQGKIAETFPRFSYKVYLCF